MLTMLYFCCRNLALKALNERLSKTTESSASWPSMDEEDKPATSNEEKTANSSSPVSEERSPSPAATNSATQAAETQSGGIFVLITCDNVEQFQYCYHGKDMCCCHWQLMGATDFKSHVQNCDIELQRLCHVTERYKLSKNNDVPQCLVTNIIGIKLKEQCEQDTENTSSAVLTQFEPHFLKIIVEKS